VRCRSGLSFPKSTIGGGSASPSGEGATGYAVVVLVGLASDGATQEALDLGKTTCTQFLAMSREQSLIIIGWLGYFLDDHA